MDGCENMFVYGSGSGVPYPWQELSMSMLAGDLWIMSSYVIHRGGDVPKDAPPGSTRIIAFTAIAKRRVDYETAVPIITPPWAEAPAQQLSPPSPKAVRCTAAQCNRVVKADPPAKCFACDERPLCAVHVGQLCVDCQRDSGKPFKLAVKNSMRGRCLRRPRVSRRGLAHVLNMETLDVGLRHLAARQRLALGEATRDRRKRRCMYA